jgi:hypothetical protein
MNSSDSSDLNVTTILALRQESDALRVITERLKVKEMGPADHIRTKHEVKAWLEGQSELKEAAAIIERTRQRRENQTKKVAQKMIEGKKQGQQMGQ